ncbi:MAG: triose-phosphate isomerase [Candidatus Saccharibacteria bacterium]|nr:triose-phosphate isomerase [Candidatus Saccharibacteria bacterium]
MKTYIVGNWKMNFTVGEASIYLQKLLKKLKLARGLEVVIAPSAIALQSLSLQLSRHQSKIRLAAQNFYHRDFGAYTGEISVAQLQGLVNYAIIGHSERRHIFHETNKDLREKVAAAIRNNITPILCLGETENEKTFGETTEVLRDQLLGGLSEVDIDDLKKVIIAYEPVWAISSTKSARPAAPDDIAQAVKLIREQLTAVYGAEISDQIPVLFGGSVNPNNAGAYLTIPGINGLLIGGASLISDQFADIIETAKKVKS